MDRLHRAPLARTTTCRTSLVLLLLVAAQPSLGAQVGRSVGVRDANTVPEAEVATMPHMTADLAKALVAARPFASATALDAHLATAGKLSAEQRAALYARLFVHIDLNAASREEIQLIPGMGPRMVREFLEYRPYRDMAVFRREIGKYVNAEEVARLEQYTFIPMDINTASDEDLLSIPGLGPRMLREFKEYRPYRGVEQFRREIGKYVDAKEVGRLERYILIR
jgi:DNA uptake protein ComE-like DNA-binding protein